MHSGGIVLKAVVIVGVFTLAVWGVSRKGMSPVSKAAFALLGMTGLGSGILGIYLEVQHIQHGTPLISRLGMIKSALAGTTIGIAIALLLTGQFTAIKPSRKSR